MMAPALLRQKKKDEEGTGLSALYVRPAPFSMDWIILK